MPQLMLDLQMARDATKPRLRRAVAPARKLEGLDANGVEHVRRDRVQLGLVESNRSSRDLSPTVNQKQRRHGLRIILARYAQVAVQHDCEFDRRLFYQLTRCCFAVLRDSDDLRFAIESLRKPVEVRNRQMACRAIGLEEDQ